MPSLSEQTSVFGAGGSPPQELPARMTAFTPDSEVAATEGPRQRLYARMQKLHSQSELKGNFCTDPLSEVVLTVAPEDREKVFRKQYPIAQSLVTRIDEVIQRWAKEGKIKHAPTGCRYNSPLLAVPKKDDQGRMTGVRVCVDVRLLNKYLVEDDKFPLPHIPDMLASFAGGKLFGEYDLSEAYFQFRLHADSQQYTAFTWQRQQYVFVGCPFGIKHIPSLFQRFICNLFRDMPFVFPYIDNLGFASSSWEEHYEHAARIMERLNSVNLRVKPSSINLGNTHMKLLGHVLSEHGVSIDPEKRDMIMQWPRPVAGSELASALGLGAFLRDHVRHYADITAPLERAKKEKTIDWNIEQRAHHWDLFKRAFATVPLLRFPDFSKRFVLATDASQTGIGGILYQPDDDEDTIKSDNIVAIASKQLDSTQRNYPVYKKELFAVIYCLRKFHSYLWGRKVKVLTDHKPLEHIANQKLMTVALQQWLDVLLDYDLVIQYRPGIMHVVPDALSRMYASTYQQEDVVWGTRTNLQFVDTHERLTKLASPSDSLCQQSLNEIKPLSAIKKRHQVPTDTASGGGGKEVKHKKTKSKHVSTLTHSLPTLASVSAAVRVDFSALLQETVVDAQLDTRDECECSGPLFAASDPLCARLASAVIRSHSFPTHQWVWPERDESRWQSHSDDEDPFLYLLRVDSDTAGPRVCALTDEEKLLLAQEKRGKICPPVSERAQIIEAVHALGHFGEKAMQHHIDRKGYWWPGLRQDLAAVVTMCTPCRQYNITKSGYHPARSVDAFLPGDHLMIDLAFFPPSTAGHHYCLVCIDVFSGFLFLKPLKTKDATDIAQALWEITSVIGVPRVLQSDNGSEFKNAIIAALTRLQGIEHRFISAYNPRADGKVERSVKTVKSTVNKLMHGATCYWHLHLPFVQYAYNNKVQALTGSTPFSLMFGREPNAAINYEFDDEGHLKDVDVWKKHQEEVFSLVFPAVTNRRNEEQKKSRARVDKLRRHITDESLPTGTVVMIKDAKYLLDPSKKPSTAPTYVGPYSVVRRTAHGPYVLNDDRGVQLQRVVPLDQMKVLYTPDDAPAGSAEKDDPTTVYVVEKIISHRQDESGELEFLVKWKGYSSAENSWLTTTDFHDHNIVHDYLTQVHGLRRSARSRAQTPATQSVVASTSQPFIHPARLALIQANGIKV